MSLLRCSSVASAWRPSASSPSSTETTCSTHSRASRRPTATSGGTAASTSTSSSASSSTSSSASSSPSSWTRTRRSRCVGSRRSEPSAVCYHTYTLYHFCAWAYFLYNISWGARRNFVGPLGGVITWHRAVDCLASVGNGAIYILPMLPSYKYDDIVVTCCDKQHFYVLCGQRVGGQLVWQRPLVTTSVLQHCSEHGFPRSWLKRFADECTEHPTTLFRSQSDPDTVPPPRGCDGCLTMCMPCFRKRSVSFAG